MGRMRLQYAAWLAKSSLQTDIPSLKSAIDERCQRQECVYFKSPAAPIIINIS